MCCDLKFVSIFQKFVVYLNLNSYFFVSLCLCTREEWTQRVTLLLMTLLWYPVTAPQRLPYVLIIKMVLYSQSEKESNSITRLWTDTTRKKKKHLFPPVYFMLLDLPFIHYLRTLFSSKTYIHQQIDRDILYWKLTGKCKIRKKNILRGCHQLKDADSPRWKCSGIVSLTVFTGENYNLTKSTKPSLFLQINCLLV